MENSVNEWLLDTLAKKFYIDSSNFNKKTSLEDIGLDSLAQLSLISLISKEFSITISDIEVHNLKTINDFEALILKGV